ncbi:MAG: hypothetical protein QOH78_1855, partial [Verrucomicrobiota bacterium]
MSVVNSCQCQLSVASKGIRQTFDLFLDQFVQ